MTWNGVGIVEPPGLPEYPAVAGDLIRATYFNTIIQALCDDFLNAVPRDGQAPMEGSLDMANTYRLINLPAATAPGHSVRYNEFFTLQTTVNGLAAGVEPFILFNLGII